jgi:ketosteroid isomerase-like protein
VAFYADDAVLLPPNAPIATDRKSIRESWSGLLGPNTAVSWKVSKVEVAKSCDGKWKCIVDTYNSDLPAAP